MNKKIKMTLLSLEDLDGTDVYSTGKLEVFKKYGTMCAVTDLAILTIGCDSHNDEIKDDYHVIDDNSLKGRTAIYYTKTSTIGDGDVSTVDADGWVNKCLHYDKSNIIRPVLELSDELFDAITQNSYIDSVGLEEVKFGSYPQYAPDKKTINLLENTKLNVVNYYYTFDVNTDIIDFECFSKFRPTVFNELEYNNRKYIKIKPNTYWKNIEREVPLSNFEKYNNDNYVYLEVSPVEWFVDRKKKKLICKKGLLSGIAFSEKTYRGEFDETIMNGYLNEYMLPELLQHENIIDLSRRQVDYSNIKLEKAKVLEK